MAHLRVPIVSRTAGSAASCQHGRQVPASRGTRPGDRALAKIGHATLVRGPPCSLGRQRRAGPADGGKGRRHNRIRPTPHAPSRWNASSRPCLGAAGGPPAPSISAMARLHVQPLGPTPAPRAPPRISCIIGSSRRMAPPTAPPPSLLPHAPNGWNEPRNLCPADTGCVVFFQTLRIKHLAGKPSRQTPQ